VDEEMIIKQNRGRHWLDWERRMVKVAQAAGIGACVWLLVALFFGEMGLPRYLAMRDHAVQLDEELSALREETALLRKDIGRLQHDPSKIEQLARQMNRHIRRNHEVCNRGDYRAIQCG
jgi:cell division protein FtsB